MFRRHHALAFNAPQERRALLRGAAASLGLNLAGLLRAEAAATQRFEPRIKSCIIVFYYGGPSHLDTYDMKPEAPAEVRGEFKPIGTSVPGLHVCEHLPRMARVMHKVALLRGVTHGNRLHDSASAEALTGRQSPQGDREEFVPIAQFFPCHGATLSFLRRHEDLQVPHAALPFLFHNVIDVPCQGGGFLGTAHDPILIEVDPTRQAYGVGALKSPDDMPSTRLMDRRRLRERFDGAGTGPLLDHVVAARELHRFHERAYRLLARTRLSEALDLTREPTHRRERYGFDSFRPSAPVGGAENGVAREMRGQNLLLARRLVEAGVPFVNVNDFRQQGQNWDAHANGFIQHRDFLLPIADRALSALIEDLDERGLLDSTLVVAMGEFGRTPRINPSAGRDHWPDCYSVLLAGGGVRGGAVLGASDRQGAYPELDPVTPADIAATIFWRFGIDPATHIHDLTGRPWKLSDGAPLTRLFS